MRKIILSVLFILSLAGCSGHIEEKEDENENNEPVLTQPSIKFEGEELKDSLDFGMRGGDLKLVFTSSVDWNIVVEESTKSVGWIKAVPSSGKAGKAQVALSVSANDDYEDRAATVTLNAGDLSKSFEIVQNGKETISVSPSTVELDALSQTFSVTVNSNVDFQVSIDESCTSWLRLQEETKSAPVDTVLAFIADKNEGIDVRSGYVTITGGGRNLTLKVTQEGDTSAQDREKEILLELRKSLTINNTDFEYWGQPWNPEIPVEQWAGLTFENGYVTEIICPEYKSSLVGRIHHLGRIPASIGELVHLKSLVISDKNLALTELIPEEIGNLESLETLIIRAVNIPGPIPSEIGNMKNLKTLFLSSEPSGINMTGQQYTPDPFISKSIIPETIGNLTGLESLRIEWIFDGDLPEGLGNLVKLKELEVYQPSYYLTSDYDAVDIVQEKIGVIPEAISGMKDLQSLSLTGGFSGGLPASIGGLSSLEYMSISSDFLEGSLPESICNLSRLKQLSIHAPKMSGNLPENIGSLASLTGLNLYGRFGGPLSESLGNCKNLRTISLDADFTSFPGSLSFILDEKNNCNTNNDVGLFKIGNNRMKGKIPSEILNHKNFYLFAPNFLQRQQDGFGFDLDGFRLPACREKYTDLIGGGAVDFDKIYKENPYTLVLRYNDFNMDFVNELVPIVKRLAEKHPRLKVICSYIGNPDASKVRSFAQRTGMSQFPHIKDGMGVGITNNLFYNDTDGCRQSSPTLGVIDSEGYYALIWCNGWYPRMTSNFDRSIADKYFVDTGHLEAAVDALFKEIGGGNVLVTGLVPDKESISLNVGETTVLGVKVIPENATNKKLIWTSDRTDIASVDAVTGKIAGLKEGMALVTVSATDGSGVSASCSVTVKKQSENPDPEVDPATVIRYCTNDGNPVKCGTLYDYYVIKSEFENGSGALYFDRPLTGIQDGMFRDAANLSMISIPESVTRIGGSSFYGCTSLEDIYIPKNVTSIDVYAFRNTGLKTLYIPENVTTIGACAFADCVNLREVEIDVPYITLKNEVFMGCTGLEKVSIKGDLFVQDDVFKNCTGTLFFSGKQFKHELLRGSMFKEIVFEESVENIPYCSSSTELAVEKITIKGNPVLNNYSFGFQYKSLRTVIIESDSFASLPVGTFNLCESLERITLPHLITEIKDYTFAGCSSLEEVTFKGNITSIGGKAFMNCSSLKRIAPGSYLEHIGTSAFEGCTSLREMDLPRSLKTMESNAFNGCSSLTNVILPHGDHFNTINIGTFANCTSIGEITFPDNITAILTREKGNNMTGKPYGTMSGCTSLMKAELPSNLTYIDPYMFYGCISLVQVTIKDKVKSIGKGTFEGCSGLVSLTVPASVKSFGEHCFLGCSGMKSIYCLGVEPPINVGSDLPKSVIVYVPAQALDKYKEHMTWFDYDIRPMSD